MASKRDRKKLFHSNDNRKSKHICSTKRYFDIIIGWNFIYISTSRKIIRDDKNEITEVKTKQRKFKKKKLCVCICIHNATSITHGNTHIPQSCMTINISRHLSAYIPLTFKRKNLSKSIFW